MDSTIVSQNENDRKISSVSRRLFVSWQNPTTREICPVGCLTRTYEEGVAAYEFRYLKGAIQVEGFRPFIGFSDFATRYVSPQLFPFFENRLVSRERSDYEDFVTSLALPIDADPFEVLARTEGRRATDAIEIFPEPVTTPDNSASCHFLVRGISHLDGANEAIEQLSVGDRLHVLLDPQNERDTLAVLLRNGTYDLIGYIPRFLTQMIHGPHAAGEIDHVQVHVEHIGLKTGPAHLRLICHIRVPWPYEVPVLSSPEYDFVN